MENTSPQSTRTLAFLRAINVGGHVVKMDRLRQLLCELGLKRVGSYIQTGNLFFEMPDDQTPDALTQRIEAQLLDALGYAVPTFLRTVAQVERALQLEAFEGLDVGPDTRQLVLFTSAALPLSLEVPLRLPVRSPAGDFEIVGVTPGEVLVQLRLVNGRAGNPAAWIEKTWGVKTTARFVGTTFKILQAAKEG